MTTDAPSFDDRARTWDDDPAKHERARRTAEAIAAAVPDLASRRVLDYGCGTGLLGFALLPQAAHVTFADTSREMLAVVAEKAAAAGPPAAGRAAALALDLSAGPPPAARFGLVATLMTLHHVRDTASILRAFHGLLEPGGLLAVADLDLEDGSFHGPGADVHPGFDRGALAAALLGAGFEAPRVSTVFEVVKEGAAGRRAYTVFLALARRG